MKVGIVTVGTLPLPSVKGGGAETLIEQIIEKNEECHEIDFKVYSIEDEEAEKKAKEFKYTRFMFLPKQNNPILMRIKRKIIKIITDFDIPICHFSYNSIIKDIKKEKFDFIIIENTMVPFYKYSKIFGKRVILHTHFNYISKDIPSIVLKKYKKAINISSGIITVSEFIKNQIINTIDVSEEKVCVLKNATDIYRFNISSDKDKRKVMRAEYGLKDEIVIVFAGRLSKEKGVVELVQAYKQIKKSNVKLVIVGSPKSGETITNEYTQKLYGEIKSIQDKVIFTGYVPYEKMPLIYAMADIAALPSIGVDAAPLTVFEAMAAGLPIVTTYSGGIPEYANEKCALFCNIDEKVVESIRSNMEILINDDNRRTKMAYFARETSKKYSIEQYYKDFVNILNSKKNELY